MSEPFTLEELANLESFGAPTEARLAAEIRRLRADLAAVVAVGVNLAVKAAVEEERERCAKELERIAAELSSCEEERGLNYGADAIRALK